MSEISCSISLNGKEFAIDNNTADEPILVIKFFDFLPQNLKLAMGKSVFEHLVNYDQYLDEMEW